jgi:hypothetical protein
MGKKHKPEEIIGNLREAEISVIATVIRLTLNRQVPKTMVCHRRSRLRSMPFHPSSGLQPPS